MEIDSSYLEKYILSEDKEAFLKTLTPTSPEYYYLSNLQNLN